MLHLIPIDVRHIPKGTPFVTSKEDPDVYCQRATYSSSFYDEIVVQDCIKDGVLLRRLLFDKGTVIQSEVPLKSTSLAVSPKTG